MINLVYTLCSLSPGQIQYDNMADLLGHWREKLATLFVIKYAFYIYYFYRSNCDMKHNHIIMLLLVEYVFF